MRVWSFNSAAFGICAAASLAACSALPLSSSKGQGDIQRPIGAPGITAQSRSIVTQAERDEALHGYYLAKFTTVVGSGLPFSSLCLKFTISGTWSSTDNGGLKGTYLISGKELFASALGYWSPPVYITLQGFVKAKQGSGVYIVGQTSGVMFSGGTFTMSKQNKTCSLGRVKEK